MANNERLTKRVKKIEDCVAENEEMGGPKGYLDTVVSMYQSNITLGREAQNLNVQFQNLRAMAFEFIEENKLTEEWNEFLQEKDKNAVQKQQTEEVSVQEEAESSEETVEAPKEEIKD